MGRGDAPTLEDVDEYDADGDGRVTREEYLAGFLRDGIDLTADYLLMRKIAWEKCEKLDDFELIKKGEDLMLEGNFLRTAITSGEHKQTWPLCVPRRDVSLPGCALNDQQKTKIYKQLAKEFATGNLKGTFKENFVKRQRDAVTARSLRKKDSETVATIQSIREKDYTPFQIKTMRLDWLRRCELWLIRVKESKEAVVVKRQRGITDTRKKSVDDLLGEDGRYRVRGREAAKMEKGRNADGLSHYSLNPHLLRENALRAMYPNMKFRESGLRKSEKICFGKFYQSQVLDPKRYNRAYELERTSVQRSFNASRRSNASQMESLRTTGNFWESVKRYNDPRGVSF